MKIRTVTTKFYLERGFGSGVLFIRGGKRPTCRILVGNKKKRENLEDLSLNIRIILKLIFRKWNGAGPNIDVGQNRDWWRCLLNEVTNHRVP